MMSTSAARFAWTAVSICVLSATVGCQTGKSLSYVDMLDQMTNLERLPVIEPGVHCKQFSSYDRRSRYDAEQDKYIAWNANGDAGNFLRVDPDTHEAVMAEMDGPGCIFRIWSANPQGLIRFYLDGDTEPTYEWNFHELCTGRIEPFIEPLVWKRDRNNPNSASDIYLPISFNTHCKVTGIIRNDDGTTAQPHHYYIIDYRTFPKDWEVETVRFPLTAENRAAVERTAQAWAAVRPGPTVTREVTVQPGNTALLTSLNGPRTITGLHAKIVSQSEPWATRKVLLRAYWDGAETPAIDCPIGDFFGEPKDVNYHSYPMAITDTINSCYFPMPFRKSARLEVVNQGTRPVVVRYAVESERRWFQGELAQFHAKFRCELSSITFDYPLLEATGTGKLVGICLFPDNIHGGWWGEGDEKVYVDGEKFPSWFGTGSEDYFGDAWGIRHFENPSHGHPQQSIERMQGCYRWHLADNIPFYRSFRMTIENYTGDPEQSSRNDYYSVAYWYQLPGGSDFFTEIPVEDRIPRGYVAPDAIELERAMDLDALGAGMLVVNDENLPKELSRGRGIKLFGKVGETRTVLVPIPETERYRIALHAARGVEASTFELLHDGRPIDGPVLLDKGMARIGVRFTGKPVAGDRCEVILDFATIHVHRNMITSWMVIGPFPNDGKGLHTAFGPEKNPGDFTKTYEGRSGEPVGWHEVSNPSGMITFAGKIEPIEDFVIYGAAIVRSPSDRKETLLLGSDDGVKVWLNGKVVFQKEGQRRLIPDDDRVEVQLTQGDNLLLIKIEQQKGEAGWAARFFDPQDELTFALPE